MTLSEELLFTFHTTTFRFSSGKKDFSLTFGKETR